MAPMPAALNRPKAPKRTEYGGRTYGSKTEAAWAQVLDDRKARGEIHHWIPQVKCDIGDAAVESTFLVDFLVFSKVPGGGYAVHAEDPKGIDTREWRRRKKQWAYYGQCELHVIKRKKVAEVVRCARRFRSPERTGVGRRVDDIAYRNRHVADMAELLTRQRMDDVVRGFWRDVPIPAHGDVQADFLVARPDNSFGGIPGLQVLYYLFVQAKTLPFGTPPAWWTPLLPFGVNVFHIDGEDVSSCIHI